MNCFKLLFCTLLATSMAASCMEKPAINNLINQQFDLRIQAGIDGEEKCRMCSGKSKKYSWGFIEDD